MKKPTEKTKNKTEYKHGDKRLLHRFAFWPTKVVDSQGQFWTIWLERYYLEQQFYDPSIGWFAGGSYWYNLKKYIV